MQTHKEEYLILLLQKKDKKCIQLLYQNYANSLYGVILKIHTDKSLAEDILQETFVKIWKYSEKYDPKKAKLFTWMYQITRNTAIDYWRKNKRIRNKEVRTEFADVYNLQKVEFNQDVIDIKKHLNTLEAKYKNIIEALVFEGMTQVEASENLNLPLGTVKSRYKIAIRELRKIYLE